MHCDALIAAHTLCFIYKCSSHTKLQCDTYERVMRHVWMRQFTCLLRIIGLFCERALQKRLYSAKETYDGVICMNAPIGVTCMNAPIHMNECIMSRVWMSQVICMNECCYTWQWVTSSYTLHDSSINVTWCIHSCELALSYIHTYHSFIHITCYTWQWVTSRVWMSRVASIRVHHTAAHALQHITTQPATRTATRMRIF